MAVKYDQEIRVGYTPSLSGILSISSVSQVKTGDSIIQVGNSITAKRSGWLTYDLRVDQNSGYSQLYASRNGSATLGQYFTSSSVVSGEHEAFSETLWVESGDTLEFGAAGGNQIQSAITARVSFNGFDTGTVATTTDVIYKYAHRYSESEKVCGYDEITGKDVFCRTIYFPTDVTSTDTTYLNVGTAITPVDSINVTAQIWDIKRTTTTGTNHSPFAFNL